VHERTDAVQCGANQQRDRENDDQRRHTVR
jgi:hypothetical protein